MRTSSGTYLCVRLHLDVRYKVDDKGACEHNGAGNDSQQKQE